MNLFKCKMSSLILKDQSFYFDLCVCVCALAFAFISEDLHASPLLTICIYDERREHLLPARKLEE